MAANNNKLRIPKTTSAVVVVPRMFHRPMPQTPVVQEPRSLLSLNNNHNSLLLKQQSMSMTMDSSLLMDS
jgi:hypothetical protein